MTETIDLVTLRQMANKKNKNRRAAQRALTQAEILYKKGKLGNILIDREVRQIQVCDVTDNSYQFG